MSHNFDAEYLANGKFYILVAFGINLLAIGVIQLTPYEAAGKFILMTSGGPGLLFCHQMYKLFRSGLKRMNNDDQPNEEL